jgi:hypothetical protein
MQSFKAATIDPARKLISSPMRGKEVVKTSLDIESIDSICKLFGDIGNLVKG